MTSNAVKEIAKYRRKAEQAGWRVYRTERGRWMFQAPDGKTQVLVSETADARALNNARSMLKSAGLKV